MNPAERSCPQEILDWIAWYPDEGLSAAQRGAVEAHAAACAACRREIDVVAGRGEPPGGVRDAERLFARVLARIESETLAAAAAPPRVEDRRAFRTPAPARRARWSRPAAATWAAAAALALLFTGIGWVAGSSHFRGSGLYHTATDSLLGDAGHAGVRLDLVFRSDAGAERINTALRGLGAEIVSGPTQLGRYRIELPPGSDAEAAAALLRAEGTGVASFAEPVRP
jgi:hypothetical protein